MYIDQSRYKLSWERRIILNLIIAVLYVLAGKLGLVFGSHNSTISCLWPLSGLALAAVLIFGAQQVMPGILIGVAIIAFQNFMPPITIIGLFFSSVAENLIASMLIISAGKGKFRFKSPKDIFFFILIAVCLAPFVSSTMSTTFLFMGGVFETNKIPFVWFNFCRELTWNSDFHSVSYDFFHS